MRLIFDNYPITLILCLIWSVIAFFFIIINIDNPVRVILSIPVIIFIPGHMLIGVLFPGKKTDSGIDFTERIVLSLGVSIAIVPLFGIVLFYTVGRFELISIILSLESFILVIGSIAIYRWFKTPLTDRFTIEINISLPKHENKLDKTLTIILIITVIITLVLFTFIIITPMEPEKFTEFYYKPVDEKQYPRYLEIGQNASIILGIANHEYKTINYTIEVWLLNQSIVYNETTKKNETVYNNLWFMDKINVTLEHKPINLVENWEPQWEYNYTFSINHLGDFKMVFLLYTSQTPDYVVGVDYIEIADEKVNSDLTSAYRNIHLRLTVV
ncbi:MAG: DUF1616 domain-containing protein [Candidatus Thermoplasmatota archaeon]|jgi:uncharacterized membrane protein|nr:DUF1616 domain-containing protein [Candidatus Thermoplasmatota archaeon]